MTDHLASSTMVSPKRLSTSTRQRKHLINRCPFILLGFLSLHYFGRPGKSSISKFYCAIAAPNRVLVYSVTVKHSYSSTNLDSRCFSVPSSRLVTQLPSSHVAYTYELLKHCSFSRRVHDMACWAVKQRTHRLGDRIAHNDNGTRGAMFESWPWRRLVRQDVLTT